MWQCRTQVVLLVLEALGAVHTGTTEAGHYSRSQKPAVLTESRASGICSDPV